MPAVELGRLQQQVNQLSDLFQDPPNYLYGVESILKDHAGPAHRQGRVKGLCPMLRSYEVPPPLLKILTLEMSLQARLYPEEAIAIADGLWEQETVETRQLAIHLLGSIVLPSLDEITQRLEAWASENQEQLLAPELAGIGTRSLRSTAPDQLLLFASKLINKKDYRKQILCLGMLQNLVLTNHFPNLPGLFELLLPACKKPDRKIRPELASLLGELARNSPKETEYFLDQLLNDKIAEDSLWLVRQALKALPVGAQTRLLLILRDQ